MRRDDAFHYRGQCSLIVLCGRTDASAVGTTVLQLKEIPRRPPRFDGALYLGGTHQDIKEALLRERFCQYGTIKSCTLQGNSALVQFDTHEDALSALSAETDGNALSHELGQFLTVQYNERSYDERGW